MLKTTLAGMRLHKLRTLLTGLAVVIGVSFLAGTLVYGDTAKAAFFDDLARPGANVDVAVAPGFFSAIGSDRRFVDEAALARVAAVPGVAAAEGRWSAPLAMLNRAGRVITNDGFVGKAVSLPGDPRFSMFTLVSGTLPQRDDEAALDKPTASREGVTVGDPITVVDTAEQKHRLTVTAIVDYGASSLFAKFSVVALTTPAIRAIAHPAGFSEIVAAATPGTDPATLSRRVAAVVDQQYVVSTGDDFRDRLAADSAKYVEGFLNILLASAIVALVVACLVVYNTFSILVAQRTRELALLRCVGASRRQIFGMVLIESAVVGAIASAAGVLASLGIGRLMLLGRNITGGGVPDHALVVQPTTVVAALIAGTLTTMLAGALPARAASRVPPLAALRVNPEVVDDTTPAARTARIGGAAALALFGLFVTAVGARPGAGFRGTPMVLGGAMIVFVAMVAVLPLVIGRFAGAVGWLPSRVFGVTGRMATTNARRNPRRAAAITTALMIGTSLLSLFSVVLATFRVQATRELAENFPIDFSIGPANYGAAETDLPQGMVDRLRQRPELGVVVRARVGWTRVDGEDTEASAVDPASLGTDVSPEIMTGSLADLKPGTLALRRDFADSHGLAVGDRVVLGWGFDDNYTVVATYDDTPTRGNALVTWSDFDAAVGRTAEQILVRRAGGVPADAAHAALDQVLAGFPLVTVTSSAEQRDALLAELNKRQAQFIGLLGMSTLIAVLGIMNTLALSVLERTRESATLRALGLAARQLRRMLVLEALIMALVAAIIGVVFGVGFGWVTAGSLIGTYGHGWPEIPVLELLGYVALPAVAGMIAAVLPARRATRASITAAMADT